jgi:hypothetical protein
MIGMATAIPAKKNVVKSKADTNEGTAPPGTAYTATYATPSHCVSMPLLKGP